MSANGKQGKVPKSLPGRRGLTKAAILQWVGTNFGRDAQERARRTRSKRALDTFLRKELYLSLSRAPAAPAAASRARARARWTSSTHSRASSSNDTATSSHTLPPLSSRDIARLKEEWRGGRSCPLDPLRRSRQVEEACPTSTLSTCSYARGKRVESGERGRGKPEKRILAPTFGLVVCVLPLQGIITLYIPREANHNIFAPIGGRVGDIKSCQGHFSRPELEFVAETQKDGRLSFKIENQEENTCVDTWIEVGKRSYITDRVKLLIDKHDMVEAGQHIGEIILGSLSEIHLFNHSPHNVISYHIKPGDYLIGGQSVLATIHPH